MSTEREGVLVVGSINVDLVTRVERLPRAGETVAGGSFAQHGGGKGANQAVAAARAGAAVTLAGAVGDDAFGRACLEELRAEGVDVSAVTRSEEQTGVAAIVVDAAGENQIAVASGANHALAAASVAELLDQAPGAPAVVVVNHETSDAINAVAAAYAARVGARLVVNPAPSRPLPPEVLACGPVLTPNRDEAAALSGADDSAAAALALHERTGAPVAVTLGADGVALAVEGECVRLPAPAVRAVDTTGAGDVFTGTLAAALAGGADVRDAVETAIAAAARAVTVAGARGRPEE